MDEKEVQCTTLGCIHVATEKDIYGRGGPYCPHCMDYLERSRWAVEHGFPTPAEGALWPAPKQCKLTGI